MRFTVLGAGAFGGALAAHLVRQQHEVILWGRNATALHQWRDTHTLAALPNIVLPPITVCEALSSALNAQTEVVLIATPCAAFRQMLQAIHKYAPQASVIWVCKGFDSETGAPLDTVARRVLGDTSSLAALSGPTFALEVASGLPSAVTVASDSLAFAEQAAQWFHGETLRTYHLGDFVGVQVAGALKNVYAIAAGISDGLGFGANARAALVTRSLAELTRLGVCMGGQTETFMGLAGLGDLLLTCCDDQSRNRRLGLALAEGLSVDAACQRIQQVVEGVSTARLALSLGQRYRVDMPIAEQVHSVLFSGQSPRTAVNMLLQRESRLEMPCAQRTPS